MFQIISENRHSDHEARIRQPISDHCSVHHIAILKRTLQTRAKIGNLPKAKGTQGLLSTLELNVKLSRNLINPQVAWAKPALSPSQWASSLLLHHNTAQDKYYFIVAQRRWLVSVGSVVTYIFFKIFFLLISLHIIISGMGYKKLQSRTSQGSNFKAELQNLLSKLTEISHSMFCL